MGAIDRVLPGGHRAFLGSALGAAFGEAFLGSALGEALATSE